MSHDAVVVGAGVAGLFCAAALADAGLRVTVLEARRQAGGRARSWVDEPTGAEVDIGPHVVTTEHLNFLRMLQRLGTAEQVRWQSQPLIDLLDAGEVLRMANVRWWPPLHGLPNLPVALRRLSIADAASHLRLAWRAARENEQTQHRLDGLDAASWLQSMGVRPRAVDWFWRSAMLALLNLPLEQCSAAAAMRVFRLMQGRSGYHFGFPTVGLSSLYVPACLERIHAAGGELRTGTVVERLEIEGGRIAGVRLRGGERLQAPWCVLATAPPAAARLLAHTGSPALESLRKAASLFRGAPYVSTMLWLDRRVTRQCFWARVWNPEDLNTDFYDLCNIRHPGADQGSIIAANAIGPNAHRHWSDAELVARTLLELGQFAPEARGARVLHARVHRVAFAIPQPRPGTESLRPATRTEVNGLLLAGDWVATAVPCSMESAARAAALATDAVLGTRSALPPPETYGLPGLLRARGSAVSPDGAAERRRTAPPSP